MWKICGAEANDVMFNAAAIPGYKQVQHQQMKPRQTCNHGVEKQNSKLLNLHTQAKVVQAHTQWRTIQPNAVCWHAAHTSAKVLAKQKKAKSALYGGTLFGTVEQHQTKSMQTRHNSCNP